MAAILRAMLSISVATVLSRATGYARTMAQASVLWVGVVANAYAVSYLLPGLIYELFMGGILYSIFIPLLVDRMTKVGEEDARRLSRSEEHTSELQSRQYLVCRLLLEKKKKN